MMTLSIKLKPVAGGATYIFSEGEAESREQNKGLLRAVARAVTGNQMLIEQRISSQQELAQYFKVDERQWRRTLPLAWLAPDIIKLILEGKQPVDWTIQQLREAAKYPCWQAQHQFLHI